MISKKCYQLIVILLFMGCDDKSSQNEKDLIIKPTDKTESITIMENDSVKTVIEIKNAKILSINKYRKEVMQGEQLRFHENGLLSKKVDTWRGIRQGNAFEFYPSGSLSSFTFYCTMFPCYYGNEYWDSPLGVAKKTIHYGDAGKIDKIRYFDSTGNFIMDSIPPIF